MLKEIEARPICRTCRYFEPMTEVLGTMIGRCRRHAPVFTGQQKLDGLGCPFPLVKDKEWCGEWGQRND